MSRSRAAGGVLNRRILIVDDNAAIHDDFRKILAAPSESSAAVDAEAAALFDSVARTPAEGGFEISSAYQGEEAFRMVQESLADNRPFAMAFVDMRMPPGWDGLTTISRLWKVDPEIQIVLCTAYSDRSWDEIQATLTVRERWLVVKKPFDAIEVLQLAFALTEKWLLMDGVRQRLLLPENGRKASAENPATEGGMEEARRMAALGEFAARIASTLDEALRTVRDLSEKELTAGCQDPRTRRVLDEIAGTTNRAAALTRQLLALQNEGTQPIEFRSSE